MRKLNKKNKTYIIVLSILTLILLGAILIFIGFKIKEPNMISLLGALFMIIIMK